MPYTPNYQHVQNEATTVLAITDQYPTIQAAITYAETLSSSSTAAGATVCIPGGNYAEDVVIRKNVNLVGEGSGATKIQSVTYRPSSNAAGPSDARLRGLLIATLNVLAETAPSSGVFWTEMFVESGLRVSECGLEAVTIDRANFITFDRCYGFDASSIACTDSADVRFNHCNLLALSFSVDSTNSNLPVRIDPIDGPYGLLFVTQSIVNGTLEISKPDGIYDTFLLNEGGFIYDLVANDGTSIFIRGGQVYQRTLNGTVNINEYSSYTPFNPVTPSDWDSPPSSVDAALDELAARIAVLEP